MLEALEAMAARNASSLDAPIEAELGDDAATPHDTIGREDEGYALVDASTSLAGAVRHLRKTDREVLELRFSDGLTQSEIARQIGVSQMQVSRILRRATDQLRETMTGRMAAVPQRNGAASRGVASRRAASAITSARLQNANRTNVRAASLSS